MAERTIVGHNGNGQYLNQGQAVRELIGFAQQARPLLQQLFARADATDLTFDASGEVNRRILAGYVERPVVRDGKVVIERETVTVPDTPLGMVNAVHTVKAEIIACHSIAACMAWLHREAEVGRKQEERRRVIV